MMSYFSPFRRRRDRGEKGVVAIETVLVLPVLLLIAMATIELGIAWQRSREVNNATRSAARVASNLGDDRYSDFEALLTLRAGVRDADAVDAVIIYKANSANGDVPATCLSSTVSVSGLCNYYTGAQLASLTAADFPSTTSCAGAPDAAWCPLDRIRDPENNPDYIGVWVRIHQDAITGVFPGAGNLLVIEDNAVMRAEPEVTL